MGVTISYDELGQLYTNLLAISTEFDKASERRSDLEDAVDKPYGHGELRSLTGDFEKQWDDRRNKLNEGLKKVTDAATLRRVLARAQHGAATDAGTSVLLFEPVTRSWAPLRLTLLEQEVDADLQRRYLYAESVLPPRLRLFTSPGLGVGCSSTVLGEDGIGSVRWLFMPRGATFFAVLAPLPGHVLAGAAVIAEQILETVRIGTADAVTSPGFDARAFVFPAVDDDRAWRS